MNKLRKKEIVFLCVYFLFIFLLFEVAFRLYLKKQYNVSFFRPDEKIYYYYSVLQNINTKEISKDDKYLDVMLLGGSVMNWAFSDVSTLIPQELDPHTTEEIRIFHLSEPSHTSRDSRIKYDLLKSKKSDIVILYNGANDFRANNAPDEMFKEDYSHYAWYEDINFILKRKEMKVTATPYVISRLTKRIIDKAIDRRYMPRGGVIEDEFKGYLEYGKKIKTDKTLKDNFRHIIQTAQKHNAPILVLTFAYHIPEGYTFEKYMDKQFDYVSEATSYPVEVWGKPEYVAKGIDVQNQAIRELVSEINYDKLYFVDMANLLGKRIGDFSDVCHLSPKGSKKFVGHIMPVILKVLAEEGSL